MSQSNVFNYAIQLFQGLNSPARMSFSIQFSQGFHIMLSLRVERSVESLELKTYQTMIVNRDSIIQQEAEHDQARFKSFVNKISPELNFQEIASELGFPLEEVYLYARHVLYYKRGSLISKLDNYSYFILKAEVSPHVIVLTEQRLIKELEMREQKEIKDLFAENPISFVSVQRSWKEIREKYKAVDKNNLIWYFCQMLVKNTIVEIELYLIIEGDVEVKPEDRETFDTLKAMVASGLNVKEILASGKLTPAEVENIRESYPAAVRNFFKYS